MDREAFRERFNAYKNGKPVSEIYDAGLPKYGGGKGDGMKYVRSVQPQNAPNADEVGEWDRFTNDPYEGAFEDLVVTPSANKKDFHNRYIYHDPRIKYAGYVTREMLEDEANSRIQRETAIYAPGLKQVSPEFDLLFLGSGLRSNPLTQQLWRNRKLAKEIDKVVDEGIVGATKEMPLVKPQDLYNSEHFRSTVKYNPLQIGLAREGADVPRELSVVKRIESKPDLTTYPPEATYNGYIPTNSIFINGTQRLKDYSAAEAFGFPDPHAGLYIRPRGQEKASPELVSTLYPKNKYTPQDISSNIVKKYTEMPNPHTGGMASSVINRMYDDYVKALEGYGKYGLKPPTPYITSVGDDGVEIAYEYPFEAMVSYPAQVERTMDMPKGIDSRTAVNLLSNWPNARINLLNNIGPYTVLKNNLLRGTGLEITDRGDIVDPNNPYPSRQTGSDVDIDDLFDRFVDSYLDGPSRRALPMDGEEFDAFSKTLDEYKKRQLFIDHLQLFDPDQISPRFKRILSHSKDPDKYITEGFKKKLLKGSIDTYYKTIKKIKLKDYARRIKEAETLNRNDLRFAIADQNKLNLEASLDFNRSYNTQLKDADKLQFTIGNIGLWMQDSHKYWNETQLSPNRPGWMLKSLMEGNQLERQLSKDGLISVNNIQNHIKKGSDIEKYVVDKVLNEKFNGKSKIDYADFKHAVLDELISYKQNQDTHWLDYGFNRLMGNSGLSTQEQQEMAAAIGLDANEPFPLLNQIGERLSRNGVKFDTFTFTSPKIPHGNPKHFNSNTLGHSRTFTRDDDPSTMYVMESLSDWGQGHLTQRLSLKEYNEADLRMKQEIQDARNKYHEFEEKVRYGENPTLLDVEQRDFYMRKINELLLDHARLIKTGVYNPHEQYLHDNFESRQIQENLLHASRNGQTMMRYPTPETAAKIEGYLMIEGITRQMTDEEFEEYTRLSHTVEEGFRSRPKLRRGDTNVDEIKAAQREWDSQHEDLIRDRNRLEQIVNNIRTTGDGMRPTIRTNGRYSDSHATILKKYERFPKLFKKLYKNAEVRTVTDSNGNTWYEVDVPKRMRSREYAYGIGTAIAVGTTLKPRKRNNNDKD